MVVPDNPEAGLYRLTLQQTPSPTDPEGADELYKALGIVIVAWGRLEGQFVMGLLTLLNLPGGKKLGEQLPMSFDRRAALWSKGFETMTPLHPFRDIASTLLTRIEDAATDRHLLVHALWEAVAPTEPITIDIVNIKPKKKTKNGLETRRNTVTVAKLREASERINQLNLDLAPVTKFLTWYRSSLNPPPANIRMV
jgi:hypothetical protein